MRPQVLIAESAGFSPEARAKLDAVGDVIAGDLDRTGLLNAIGSATVLWTRLRNRIDEEVFARAAELRVVATPTTGLDHVDLAAAARAGIRVVSLQGATSFLRDVRATAELALALMLSVLRHIPSATRDVEAGRWNREAFKGGELYGKTVGVVGYGRLGRIVARYVRAFDARVVACDPYVEADGTVDFVGLPELLAVADIVTIHVPLADATRGLIDRAALARLKRGAILINTSRGDVVDEPALLDALASGHLAGAALDVLSGESAAGVGHLAAVEYAREHPALIITPHIGGCTYESMTKTEVFLADRVCETLAAIGGQRR